MHGLFLQTLQSEPAFFFATILTVVVSITLHELAHGYVAIKLGDDTPAVSGHMTLNPVVHMGTFSLILLAVAGIAFGAMPVDRTRLRGKYAEAVVAAAGPATNLLLAAVALSALGLWERFDHRAYAEWTAVIANGKYLLLIFGLTNVLLTLFNLVPLPPLDGFWIMANLIPPFRRLAANQTVRGVMGAVFFGLFLGAGVVFSQAARATTYAYLHAISARPRFHFENVIADRLTIERPDLFGRDTDDEP